MLSRSQPLSKVTQHVRRRGRTGLGQSQPQAVPGEGLGHRPLTGSGCCVSGNPAAWTLEPAPRVRDAAEQTGWRKDSGLSTLRLPTWEDPGLGRGSSSLNLSFLICQMGQCHPEDDAG